MPEEFLPYAEVVTLPQPWPDLPAYRDAKDQAFLVLAFAGQALLVSGAADIISMRDLFPGRLCSVNELAVKLTDGQTEGG